MAAVVVVLDAEVVLAASVVVVDVALELLLPHPPLASVATAIAAAASWPACLDFIGYLPDVDVPRTASPGRGVQDHPNADNQRRQGRVSTPARTARMHSRTGASGQGQAEQVDCEDGPAWTVTDHSPHPPAAPADLSYHGLVMVEQVFALACAETVRDRQRHHAVRIATQLGDHVVGCLAD
jgi:hypothetical protein